MERICFIEYFGSILLNSPVIAILLSPDKLLSNFCFFFRVSVRNSVPIIISVGF